MKKRWTGGLALLTVSLAMWAASWNVLVVLASVGLLPLGVLVLCPPLLLSVVILLRCKKSDVMAEPSAAIIGCLWGLLTGTAMLAGFLYLFTDERTNPYDKCALGMIAAACLLLLLIILLFDCIRYRKRHSFCRFVMQCVIAANLILPTMIPAYRMICLGERLLRPLVS